MVQQQWFLRHFSDESVYFGEHCEIPRVQVVPIPKHQILQRPEWKDDHVGPLHSVIRRWPLTIMVDVLDWPLGAQRRVLGPPPRENGSLSGHTKKKFPFSIGLIFRPGSEINTRLLR